MIEYKNVQLRKAREDELETLYRLETENSEWTRFNGPYFPYSVPTYEEFRQQRFTRMLKGDDLLLIIFEGRPVGTVNCYWEYEPTRWLEAGVVIFDKSCWSHGIGSKALVAWITHLFKTREVARVGLTTWSGNPRMMACAKKLGMQQEARLRRVRYYQGEYYDSVKYGVLREEWFARYPQTEEKELSITEVSPQALPAELLLEADPSPECIRGYLQGSRCFAVIEQDTVVAGCVIKETQPGTAELFNIAVRPDKQKLGLGSRLLKFALAELAGSGIRKVELGTGTFGYQLSFYQRHGFRVEGVRKDFFLDNYEEPVFEDGIQHKDMLRLAAEL